MITDGWIKEYDKYQVFDRSSRTNEFAPDSAQEAPAYKYFYFAHLAYHGLVLLNRARAKKTACFFSQSEWLHGKPNDKISFTSDEIFHDNVMKHARSFFFCFFLRSPRQIYYSKFVHERNNLRSICLRFERAFTR